MPPEVHGAAGNARSPPQLAHHLTSSMGQKEAYLRRHNMRSPQTTPRYEEPYPEEPPQRPKSADHEKTFAQKRKENLLSRARGGRRDVDVALTTVMFAAKLKRLSSADVVERKKREKEKKEGVQGEGPGEKSWVEKRKETYLRTHGAPPPPKEAAITPGDSSPPLDAAMFPSCHSG